MSRELSPEAQKEFDWLVTRYPQREAAMLPTLRLIEREFGCIDPEGMKLCAQLIGCSPAKVFGVVTFYTHYKRETDGENVVYVCGTLPCALRGSDALADYLCDRVGIGLGETTEDRKITIKKVECLALCDQAPVCQVEDVDWLRVSKEKADEMLESLGIPKRETAGAAAGGEEKRS